MAVVDELVAIFRFDLRGEGEARKFQRTLRQTEVGMQSFAANAAKFGAAAAAAIGTAFAGLTVTMSNAAIDFEDQMTGIQKKAGASAEQMAKVRDQILTLAGSGEVASPIEEISSAFERGAAAGLPLDDLREFAILSTKAADAFEMSAAEVGDAFAGFEKVLGVPRAELEKVADLVNHLADSGIADESEIVRFMDRSGAMAKTLGLSVQETAAFGAALANLKVPAGMASTAMNAIMTKLVAPEALSGKATGAMRDLVGDVDAFARALDEDADKAIVAFLQRLKGLDNAERAGAIANIFGLEHVDVVSQMVEGLDEVKRNLHEAGVESLWLGSLQRSYNLKLDDTSSKFRIFGNNMKAWLITIGDRALPILNRSLDTISEFMVRMRRDGVLGKVAEGFQGVWETAEHLAVQAYRIGRGFYYAADGIVALTAKATGLSKSMAAAGLGAGLLATSALGRRAMLAVARRVPMVAAMLVLDDIISGLNGDNSLVGSLDGGQEALDGIKKNFAEVQVAADELAGTVNDIFGLKQVDGETALDTMMRSLKDYMKTDAVNALRGIGQMITDLTDALRDINEKLGWAMERFGFGAKAQANPGAGKVSTTGQTTRAPSSSGGSTGMASLTRWGAQTIEGLKAEYGLTEAAIMKVALDISQFLAPANQALAIQANLSQGINATANLDISNWMANADRAEARIRSLNALAAGGGRSAAVQSRPQVAQSAAAP